LGDRFFVLYGDSYLPSPLAPVQSGFLASGAHALMTVLHNANCWDRSNAVYRDGRVIEYSKRAHQSDMLYIDYGLGILEAGVLTAWPVGQPFDLADVYESLARDGQLAGFEVHERFYEVGSHAGIRETEQFLLARRGA
jgi:NDP-sugar pyrophosphorylase family protein